MTWTHNICEGCWVDKEGDRVPVRVKGAAPEPCCFCGEVTASGIHVRENPDVLECVHT